MNRAYLDIETSWARKITVVGIHRPGRGTRQWVSPDLAVPEMRAFLKGVKVLMTYNGSRFDLPVVRDQLRCDLEKEFTHRDLMYDCWERNLYGGLKNVERSLGLHRDTEGVDGLMAMRLWDRYQRSGDREALEVLLRYNREDIENLELLAHKLGVLIPRREPCPGPVAAQRSAPLTRLGFSLKNPSPRHPGQIPAVGSAGRCARKVREV